MYNSQTVAEKIKARAKENNISVKHMLSVIELGENTLQNMKTSMPKADNLAKIADYLDVSVDYLLDRTDNPNINTNNIVINGDNSVQAVRNSRVSINTATDNDMMTEFMRSFESLSFADKVKAMNFVVQLAEAEKE